MKVLLMGCKGRIGLEMQKYFNSQKCEFVGLDKDDEILDYNDVDVILDFSTKDALKQNLDIAKKYNVPIVIATTGHDKNNLSMIKMHAKSLPVFMSSNFSILFNLMLKLLDKTNLKNYDVYVTEKHHRYKKDSPSGSAKLIINKLELAGVKPKVYVYRVGDVVGEHSLDVYGYNEILTIKHTAISRSVFCAGAYMACEYILKKKSGLYSMENMLDDSV